MLQSDGTGSQRRRRRRPDKQAHQRSRTEQQKRQRTSTSGAHTVMRASGAHNRARQRRVFQSKWPRKTSRTPRDPCPVEYTNYAPAPRIGITKSSRLADSERALSCSLRSLESRAEEGAVDLRRMRSERVPAACSAILSGLCGARRVARGAQSRAKRERELSRLSVACYVCIQCVQCASAV